MSVIPPVKERILVRERINKLLTGIFEYPLFIVAAPGLWQNTAVREFLRSRKTNHIWVSLAALGWDYVLFLGQAYQAD